MRMRRGWTWMMRPFVEGCRCVRSLALPQSSHGLWHPFITLVLHSMIVHATACLSFSCGYHTSTGCFHSP